MQRAVEQGPYSITCSAVAAGRLTCAPMKDEDVIPALKRGETVYGRTVVGFPGGATPQSAPKLQPSDLVCASGSGVSLSCSPVNSSKASVVAGAKTFVFYMKHDVRFKDGHPVSYLGPSTVSIPVVSGG